MNDIYITLRQRIVAFCAAQSTFTGEIEVDESCFGPKRIRGLPVRVRTQTGAKLRLSVRKGM